MFSYDGISDLISILNTTTFTGLLNVTLTIPQKMQNMQKQTAV